jgi:TRAP-type C4-dicarboxylate transport system substrate-binding protein
MLVVALLLTAVSTGASAREFRADTRNEDDPTVRPLRHMGSPVAEFSSGHHLIRVYHSRRFGEKNEALVQTRIGAIDLNHANVASTGALRASRSRN